MSVVSSAADEQSASQACRQSWDGRQLSVLGTSSAVPSPRLRRQPVRVTWHREVCTTWPCRRDVSGAMSRGWADAGRLSSSPAARLPLLTAPTPYTTPELNNSAVPSILTRFTLSWRLITTAPLPSADSNRSMVITMSIFRVNCSIDSNTQSEWYCNTFETCITVCECKTKFGNRQVCHWSG